MPLPPGKGGPRPGGRPHLKFAPRSVPSLLPLTHTSPHTPFLPHPPSNQPRPQFRKSYQMFSMQPYSREGWLAEYGKNVLFQETTLPRQTPSFDPDFQRRHDTNVSLANTWYKPLSPSHPSAFPIPHFQYRKVPMPITVRNLNSDLSL